MNKYHLIPTAITILLGACTSNKSETNKQPNIIFIMADDLGYGDLGCYGQKVIKTPNLDNLSKDGILFTDCYAGSPVSAPSRNVLMTGMHTGHTTVRGNFGKGGVVGLGGGDGRVPLKEEDVTVAEILKSVGYTTGMTGKWGIGEPNTSGLPNDQGFDEWFGFLNQRRAHHHYTDFLWKNKEKWEIAESDIFKPEMYTHNLFTDFSLDFIQKYANGENPFFLYIPYLLPHDEYEIPEVNEAYKDKDWTDKEKVHASMVSLIDSDVGRIVQTLKELGIERNTLLIFTSDNGAAIRWDGRFDSSGKLRGRKRDVYEGGIRAPMIVSMPGTVPADVINHTPWTFADVLPTLVDFAGATIPSDLDGISLKEVITKNTSDIDERIFYWEFHEGGGKQAVRMGDWKGVRLNIHADGFHNKIELYDLSKDIGEENNLADQHPEIVEKIFAIMQNEHKKSEEFPFEFEIQ